MKTRNQTAAAERVSKSAETTLEQKVVGDVSQSTEPTEGGRAGAESVQVTSKASKLELPKGRDLTKTARRKERLVQESQGVDPKRPAKISARDDTSPGGKRRRTSSAELPVSREMEEKAHRGVEAEAVVVNDVRPGLSPGEAATDSDNEAPEELSLAAGREAAAALRAQQSLPRRLAQEKRRARAKAKEQSAPTSSPGEQEEEQQGLHQDRQAMHSGATEPQAPQPSVRRTTEPERLPDDVIAALQEHAREMAAERTRHDDTPVARETTAPKKPAPVERVDGPIRVRLLDGRETFQPSGSAVSFARHQLFGRGVRRSKDMLRPTKNGRQRLYLPSVGFAQT